MLRRIFGLLVVLGLAGCSSIPDSIQVAKDTPLIPYEQVMVNPEASHNKDVRWGGVIANVENLPEQTMLELVHYPLRNYGRPVVGDESTGRFRVYVNSFLDPMVYEPGRVMTFIGKVSGSELDAVGEHEYLFPIVSAEGFYLWKDIQRVEITTHSWPYYHGWYGYYGYPMFPVHQRVVIKSSGTNQSGQGHGATVPRNSNSKPGNSRSTRNVEKSRNLKEH